MKRMLLLFMTVIGFVQAHSQRKNHWNNHQGAAPSNLHKAVSRASFPTEYKLVDLDDASFQTELKTIVDARTTKKTSVVSLPNADGGMEDFELIEASNFEPALQAKFPEIRAYTGRGISDPSAIAKISISPQGMQGMLMRSGKENEYIEQYSNDRKTYAVFRSQNKTGKAPWTCATQDQQLANNITNQVFANNLTGRNGSNIKTLRLAQSCNAEYSNYFGATSSAQVALVLAAFNNTLTRCNGVYEKDLALHLNLIANTTSVIYYTPSTDPYTTMASWNSQLQSTLTSVIGAANYDIGHMFGSSGGGGNAGCIGCVCVDATKGSGITSPADGIPQGDNFDIDYVVHEVGHQLGANHTFSMSNEGTGVNMEVGSGITIMGYAGITAQDVAPHSIDIFHQASIAQIQANINPKTCPVTTAVANQAPVVTIPAATYTIPRSTPFALTANATDETPNSLTYCWEQNNNAGTTQTGVSSVASSAKATGPNWISFKPTSSPTRLFPQLSTILAGALITGPLTGGDAGANTEALSSVARTLNFRVTVRDNAPYFNNATDGFSIGQTNFADVVVTVNGTAGPFGVSAPNTAVSWAGGSTQTVTWTVNSTNLAPINCANVKILLSTDGGLTFPTVLAANTPNDGTESVVLPNSTSTTARIKVEAVGNIFFDISNTNFSITTPQLCGTPTGLTTTGITNNAASLSWTAVANALNYTVEYQTVGAPSWTVLSASQAGTTASLTGLAANTSYTWRVLATCAAGAGSYVTSANFTTLVNCGVATGLTTTAITPNSATLSWTAVANALSYAVEYKTATAANYTVLTASQAGTTANLTGLTQGTAYNWRITATCAAGVGAASTAANFTTTTPSCASVYDNATNGTTAGAPVIPFNTDITGQINVGSDIDLYRFTITTAGTISLTLTVPANYHLRLLNSTGGTIVTSSNAGTTSEAINNRTVTPGVYYARVYPANTTTFNATSCYTLRVSLGTATRAADSTANNGNVMSQGLAFENGNGTLRAYPNPVSSVLNLQLGANSGLCEINVLNTSGVAVLKKRSSQVNTQLNMSQLPSGVYIISVADKNGQLTRMRVVKQ